MTNSIDRTTHDSMLSSVDRLKAISGQYQGMRDDPNRNPSKQQDTKFLAIHNVLR